MSRPSQKKTFSPGEIIFLEGDAGDCSFYVESGTVEIFQIRDGKEKVLATLNENEIIGEMAIIDQMPRSASARALTPCRLGIIHREQLADRLQSADPVINLLVNVLIQRLRHQNDWQGPLSNGIAVPKGSAREREAHTSVINKFKVEGLLRDAIAKNEFHLSYQPIIDLKEGRISGFEALLRWTNYQAQSLCPQDFISICEETNLIVPIGHWIMRQAFRDLKILQAGQRGIQGTPPLFISINISPRQLHDPQFFSVLEATRKEAGILPEQVKLEITEQLFIRGDIALQWAERARSLGYTLALDDFGTGYSGFQYLGTIPFDFLKIDKSFILKMLEDHRSSVIAKTIVQLGRDFGIPVIAEGIEGPEQLETLCELGCDFGQGYHFGRPAQLNHWLGQKPPEKSAA